MINMLTDINEIDAFIHKYFIDDLIIVAGEWFAKYSKTNNMSSRIKEPDTVEMVNAEYKYAENITTHGDCLNFIATMLCGVM